MRVCCYFKGKKHLWNAAHNALWKVKQQQQQNLENWVHTQTNFIQYIIHSFMNANTQKMCCKKGTSQKNYPKIKIPPTKKYYPNCPVRESSPYFGCVCVSVAGFPPWMPCFGLFSIHKHTNIFCQTFSGFSLFEAAARNAAPSLHTHVGTPNIYTESGRSLSLSLSRICICTWTAAAAKQNDACCRALQEIDFAGQNA